MCGDDYCWRDRAGMVELHTRYLIELSSGGACAERLCAVLLAIVPGEPRDSTQKSAPREESRARTNLNGMWQDAQLSEDVEPVVIRRIGFRAHGNQRELAADGIAHVSGY